MPNLTWGPWEYRPEHNVLVLEEYDYEVRLDDCKTCAKTLDWIHQIAKKAWTDEAGMFVITGALVKAIDDLVDPQANLCGMGQAREIPRDAIDDLIRRNARQEERQRAFDERQAAAAADDPDGFRVTSFRQWQEEVARDPEAPDPRGEPGG